MSTGTDEFGTPYDQTEFPMNEDGSYIEQQNCDCSPFGHEPGCPESGIVVSTHKRAD